MILSTNRTNRHDTKVDFSERAFEIMLDTIEGSSGRVFKS